MQEKKKTTTQQLSVAEAGRLGGIKTKNKYGIEHYRKIGLKGGQVTAEKNNAKFQLQKKINSTLSTQKDNVTG